MTDHLGRLLLVTLEAARVNANPPVLGALRSWLDSWRGIGAVERGMARQRFDLQLTRYDQKGWRATFYTTGMEHRPRARRGPRGSARRGARSTVRRAMPFEGLASLAKPKPEKKPATATPAPTRILPMELHVGDRIADETGEYEVIGRPYTTAGGKTAHVRVKRVDQSEVRMIRTWGAHERVAVRRAAR